VALNSLPQHLDKSNFHHSLISPLLAMHTLNTWTAIHYGCCCFSLWPWSMIYDPDIQALLECGNGESPH